SSLPSVAAGRLTQPGLPRGEALSVNSLYVSTTRPSTSSTSTGGQLPSAAERGPRPISSQGSVSRASAPPREPAGGPTVHYYWGVPFCPRGVDPDEYTQVILGHMEVYEKSLKQAQRGLLRKAEWGEAVLPQLFSLFKHVFRRGLRLRSKNVCEATDTLSVEAEEDEEDQKDEEEEREGKEEEEEETKKEGEEGQAATDDCETEGNVPVSGRDVGRQHVRKERIEEDEGDPDVEEIKDPGLQRLTSPELQPAALLHNHKAKVDCPICQGSYSVTEIERHAAYCDGEVAVVEERRPEKYFKSSFMFRRNQEKCYICQKYVPLRDYSRHTELCIQRQASKTAFQFGHICSVFFNEPRFLVSMFTFRDVIDLRDDDDDDDDDEEEEEERGGGSSSVSSLRINNSPIRAFTPISEATGCLIDFKKQQRAKTLRQRRR
uniref:Uncharacterized protein n=1 Tax=Cyclopterus lumpus TaxID=8103 RepID=A0A8C2X2H2_CYCLU